MHPHPHWALLLFSINPAGLDQVVAEAPPLGSLVSKWSPWTTSVRIPGGRERVQLDAWASLKVPESGAPGVEWPRMFSRKPGETDVPQI